MTTVFHKSVPRRTDRGTPYLTEPGVAVMGRTQYVGSGFHAYLAGFPASERFEEYTQDDPAGLTDGARLAKTAGQLCYMSFGPKRTKNDEALRYLRHIIESKHGSVLEHVNVSLLFYGVSRSCTHELVRHRHAGYSQVSQRYVGGPTLRFVERPEYQDDPELHARFCDRIDRTAEEYRVLTEKLLARDFGADLGTATERRKAVQQTARSALTNETETALVMTTNLRNWRYVLEQRGSVYAEPEIRALALRTYEVLNALEPMFFSDFSVVTDEWGVRSLVSMYPKV